MDLVTIPHALFVVYGAIVLSCGGGLGFILGRHLPRRKGAPQDPTNLLERRVSVLESEIEAAQADLNQLGAENEFLRQLTGPRITRVDPERRLRLDVA